MVKYYVMTDDRMIGESEYPDTARDLYDVAFHCGCYTSGTFNIALIKWGSCKDIQTLYSASFVDGKLVSYQN